MLKGKRLLAVVPARGGSKGVPLKNIRPLLGVPLVARVGKLVSELGYFDRAIVSTDHPEIAEVARGAGLGVPFFRPERLSGDLVGDYEIVRHALEEMERLDTLVYDVVVMLQPTSPLRRVEHVTGTLTKLLDEELDSVWTVSPTDLKYHPLKQLVVGADGLMRYYDAEGASIVARQQLKPIYHRNGSAYAMTRGCLLDQMTIMGRRSGALVLDEPMISIDTLDDFEAAEQALLDEGRE